MAATTPGLPRTDLNLLQGMNAQSDQGMIYFDGSYPPKHDLGPRRVTPSNKQLDKDEYFVESDNLYRRLTSSNKTLTEKDGYDSEGSRKGGNSSNKQFSDKEDQLTDPNNNPQHAVYDVYRPPDMRYRRSPVEILREGGKDTFKPDYNYPDAGSPPPHPDFQHFYPHRAVHLDRPLHTERGCDDVPDLFSEMRLSSPQPPSGKDPSKPTYDYPDRPGSPLLHSHLQPPAAHSRHCSPYPHGLQPCSSGSKQYFNLKCPLCRECALCCPCRPPEHWTDDPGSPPPPTHPVLVPWDSPWMVSTFYFHWINFCHRVLNFELQNIKYDIILTALSPYMSSIA